MFDLVWQVVTAGPSDVLVRAVGVFVGLAGTWVTGSEGWCRLRADLGALCLRARAGIRRWLPFLRPKPQVVDVRAGSVTVTGVAPAIVARAGWPPTASLSERVQWLRRQIERLDSDVQALGESLCRETQARAEEIRELREDLTGRVAGLRRIIEEAQQRAVQVDARGLPLIAIALLFTGLPEVIIALRIAGWVALLVVAALSIWVAMLPRQENRRLAVAT